jgi:hypothetical protein
MRLWAIVATGLVTGCSALPQSLPPHQFHQNIARGQYQSMTERQNQPREARVYYWGTPTPITVRP